MYKRHQLCPIVALLATACLAAAPAPPATQPAKLPFTLGKDTTAITEPLLPDGTPDFLTALNEKYGKGVRPENNALVPLLQIRGTHGDAILHLDVRDAPPDPLAPFTFRLKDSAPELEARFLRLAGATATPADAPVFAYYAKYLQAHNNDALMTDAYPTINKARQEMWTAAQHPELAAYLQSQANFFALALEASKRPRFYAPFIATDGRLINSRNFSYTGLLDVGRAWSARAMLRASSDDFDGALSDLVGIKKLARLLPQGGDPTAFLESRFWETAANDAIGTLVGFGRLTAAQRDTLAKAIDLPPIPSMAVADTQERWGSINYLMLMATGQLRPSPANDQPARNSFFANLDYAAVDWNLALRQLNAFCDETYAMFNADSPEELEVKAQALMSALQAQSAAFQDQPTAEKLASETPAAYSARLARGIFQGLSPLARVNIYLPRERQRRDEMLRTQMLQLLIAAAKSKAQTGQWPATLAALVPASLPRIPLDPHSPRGAEPFDYKVTADFAAITSVGADHTAGTSDDLHVGILPPLP